MDVNEEKDLTLSIRSSIDTLRKDWIALSQGLTAWNLKTVEQREERITPLVESLFADWQSFSALLADEKARIRNVLDSEMYVRQLEDAFSEADIPVSGEFPSYMLPPYKLSINVENNEARLSLGRRNERTGDLSPEALTKWVAVRYRKLLSRRFNANAFLKDLLGAYRVALSIQYPEEVRQAALKKEELTGLAVSIHLIYDLLTVKASARQDYPRQFFIYDLGLLKELPELCYGPYRFDLGFARDQRRALVVVDSTGRESRISSLAVYWIGTP